MRYAIISDIHGNLEALEAAAQELSGERIDEFILLGDMVGYGADPLAVIKTARSYGPKASIAGNHDWGSVGMTDISGFNKEAAFAIRWTAKMLDEDSAGYLKGLPLVAIIGNMTLVHGSLENPSEFNYILNDGDAYITMSLMKTPVCFVGHSHVPGIYRYKPRDLEVFSAGSKVSIEPAYRYLVNAGSIGQPRDGDPRASYAIFDEARGVVEIKRVSYDITKAQRKMLDAGLPATLVYRLREGK